MANYEYFLLLAGCLGSAAFAAWIFGVWSTVIKQWKVFASAVGITLLFFSIWDYFAILRKHWSFNSRYVTGQRFLEIPIEELAFFVIIPVVCILTWEIICKITRKR